MLVCQPLSAYPHLASAGNLPSTLPIFTHAGGSTGLNLLAMAAGLQSSTSEKDQGSFSTTANLHSRGPYNPAAVLPPKVAKRILDLEFVEMSDIALDDLPVTGPGQPPLPARPPVQNISIWVEKFSVMAALLTSRFPEKAPELFAYQASIMRAERNFDGRRWVAYDRCFRREALAQKNLDWSVPNARLYNEAFTGHARSLPRCSFCLQEDHQSQSCPRNPHRPWFGWFPEPSGAPPSAPGPSGKSQECCRRYNEGRCKQTTSSCRYLHRCLECAGPHPRVHCPRISQSGRPRSPLGHQQPRQQGSQPNPATGPRY